VRALGLGVNGGLMFDSVMIETILGVEGVERVGCASRFEFEPRLVDVAIRRWQQSTPRDTIHAASGLNLSEVASPRRLALLYAR
jgi:hypothetical protein